MTEEKRQQWLDEMDDDAIHGKSWEEQMWRFYQHSLDEQIEFLSEFYEEYPNDETRAMKLAYYLTFRRAGACMKKAWVMATNECGRAIREPKQTNAQACLL